jgi:hypothetical protein
VLPLLSGHVVYIICRREAPALIQLNSEKPSEGCQGWQYTDRRSLSLEVLIARHSIADLGISTTPAEASLGGRYGAGVGSWCLCRSIVVICLERRSSRRRPCPQGKRVLANLQNVYLLQLSWATTCHPLSFFPCIPSPVCTLCFNRGSALHPVRDSTY